MLNKKCCKPVSRILFLRKKLPSFICPGNYSPGSICLPCISDEQPSNDTIRGISACKVYPQMMSPSIAVGFYPTFSSLPTPSPPRRGRGGLLFSVALSVTSTYFSALVEIPGYSPVHCSVLSGLSSSRLSGKRQHGLQRMANLL